MADKKVNATQLISTVLSNDIFYVGRVSTNKDCYITALDLIASLTTPPITTVICQYNDTTSVLLASASQVSLGTIKSVTLDCYCEKNGKSRKQIVEVFYTTGESQLVEGSYATIPATETDLGITLSTDCSAGLNLVVAVDNSEANNVNFYYRGLSTISI